MNLAIRGIDANIGPSTPTASSSDLHPDLKADYVLANPPFNISDWGGEHLREDVRWKYGTPPAATPTTPGCSTSSTTSRPTGMAGFVLANGSMSSNQSGEGEIRKAMIEADLVDCMVALPGQLFYTTQIPVCLWFLARDKKNHQTARPARRDPLHRCPQDGHAGRPRPPRTDCRGHRKDCATAITVVAIKDAKPSLCGRARAFANPRSWKKSARTITCSRPAVTSVRKKSKTMANRLRKK